MLSNQELVDKYGRLCGYVAWRFVRQNHKAQPFKDQAEPLLGTADAEDLASAALVKLLKCPMEHRHEPPYIRALISNAIINAWHKRLKTLRAEVPPQENTRLLKRWAEGGNAVRGTNNSQVDMHHEEILDRVPDDGDIEEEIQSSMDSALAAERVNQLPIPERVVIELSFGLNGCKPCGIERIAKKLSRTKWWVQTRHDAGIKRLRENLGIKPANEPLQQVL